MKKKEDRLAQKQDTLDKMDGKFSSDEEVESSEETDELTSEYADEVDEGGDEPGELTKK